MTYGISDGHRYYQPLLGAATLSALHGAVINTNRRAALEKILHGAIGLNDVDTETAADSYFEVARLEEREVTDYSTQVRIPKTQAGVVDLMERHGFVESDIDRVAMETSADTLADLENLAFRHEIRREAIIRELERRRKKRNKQSRSRPATERQDLRSCPGPA
jgi:hypothetical protein